VTEEFIYWAQSLDNTSPDHIYKGNKKLLPKDNIQRQEAVSHVSKIVMSGSRIFDKRGVRLTESAQFFVVEVLSEERDQAGRIAPLICCGPYELTKSDALSASVIKGLDNFARQIGRNILPEHLELVSEVFKIFKKKIFAKKLKYAVVIGATVIILLVLAYWITPSASKEEQRGGLYHQTQQHLMEK